jgi:NDP-sugar pyrophosphorylase family protein
MNNHPTVIAIVGGEGTRMYPITLNQPKPLIPICNYPTLMRLYEILAMQGAREFIFASKGAENTIRLKDCFKYGDGFSKRLGLEPRATFRYQPNYNDRGSADAVRYCMEYYDIKTDVLVVSGDSILDVDLDRIMEEHRRTEALITVCLKEVDDVTQYGIADMDSSMKIKRFVEKPNKGKEPSNLANIGVYVLSPRIRDVFKEMSKEKVADFGKDVIPYLTNNSPEVFGYIHEGYWNDVGTPRRYLMTTYDILKQKVSNIRFKNKYKDSAWIHSSTMQRIHPEKLKIGNYVLIGGDSTIGDNVSIESSCIGDHCIIGEGSVIQGSVVMDFTNIGKHARLNNCIVGAYSTIGNYSVIDSDMHIDFVGGGDDLTPVIGEDVTIFERSVIGPKKRVAQIKDSHRILATGKFQDLGYDRANVYFIEKM